MFPHNLLIQFITLVLLIPPPLLPILLSSPYVSPLVKFFPSICQS